MPDPRNQCIHCGVESYRHLKQEQGICAPASRGPLPPWHTPATPPMKACARATTANEQAKKAALSAP